MSANATALRAQASSADPGSVDGRLDAVHTLFKEATENSRLAKYHHSKARSQFKKLRSFVQDLEAMGIEVVLEPTQEPQSPRRQSDDRSARSDADDT